MTTDWRNVFAIYLAFLLAGYALMDKSFAYAGVGFIYVSELGLLVGILAFFLAWLQGNLDFKLLKPASIWILAAFLLWSFSRTLPYIHQYRISAIRDALLWGYAAFALFVLMLVRPQWSERFFRMYGYAIPFFLIWWFVAYFLHWFTDIRHNPFNPAYPIFQLKSGDVAVHLSGVAAYMLLNIGERVGIERSARLTWFIWLTWWAVWLVYGIGSRAAMLGPILTLSVLLFLNPWRWRQFGIPVVTGALMIVLLSLTNVHLKIPDNTRNVEISANQIVINAVSLFFSTGDKPANISGITDASVLRTDTITWRIDWWKKIIAYTVDGPYFWSGKGYGINLSVDDKIQSNLDASLRSPHNIFMTILARSGMPGLLLWCAFLLSVIYPLLQAALKKDRSDKSAYSLWLLAYIVASLFNGSFDVYLEGPMGGIWFWSLIGLVYLYVFPKENTSASQTIHV